MERSPALRVGDHEREQVADELRRHAAAGRLDPDELEARLDRAYAARTGADLEPLTEDLPALDAPKPPARQMPGHALHAIAVAAALDLLALAIWAAAGAQGGWDEFWPKWVWILTTVILVRSLVRGRRDQRNSDSM